MVAYGTNSYVSGTSAVRIEEGRPVSGKFHAFEGGAVSCRSANTAPVSAGTLRSLLAERVMDVLYSSEMFCSLMLEDHRGCPYGVFSRAGVAALSLSAVAIAATAIAFGA